jgi:hypothetical protein
MPGGRLAKRVLHYTTAGLLPSLSSRRCCADSAQIGLLKPYNPGLAQRETEFFLKHGLKNGPGYPLCVDEDGAWHASIHRLKKVPGAFCDYDDVALAL